MKKYMVIVVMEDKTVNVRFYKCREALKSYVLDMARAGAIKIELYVRGPWGYELTNMTAEFGF